MAWLYTTLTSTTIRSFEIRHLRKFFNCRNESQLNVELRRILPGQYL